MTDTTSVSHSIAKIVLNIIIATRHVSMYPIKHPVVVNTIKNISAFLSDVFKTCDKLSLSISPDNKIMANGEAVPDRVAGDISGFVPLFKKLGIEELVIGAGVSLEELTEFVKISVMEESELKKIEDFNEFFKERSVTNLSAKQFSYIKVEKGREASVVGGAGTNNDPLEALKEKVRDFSRKKNVSAEDIGQMEREICSVAGAEFKQTNRFGAGIKNMVKKFISGCPQPEDAMARLKQALIDNGCPAQEVGALIAKIREEIERGPQVRAKPGGEETARIQKQNSELKARLGEMEEQLRIRGAEVEQLQRQNKRVHEEKQRIENIVHNMAEGMVVLDAQGRIVLVNPAAENLLGISKQDVGRPIREVVKDEHLLTLTRSIPVNQDSVVEKDIELIGSDESTKRVLRTSSAVVEDPNGNTVGMVTMLNDITRQKEVERIKGEFLAGVSHELRTPLVAVEKSVSLMLDSSAGALSPDQQQFLTIAHRNIKRLTLLINDLLDLAKLEAHKVELRRSLGAFDAVVRDAAENFTQWAQTKKISIECIVQPGLPEFSFDAGKITQVLTNLIGNALKFTPVEGRIAVSADMDAERLNVRVAVEDTGPGLAAADMEKVFEKFYQAKDRPVSDINGTGIGLAIVKEIVQMHGGRVWAENAQAGGARFIFTLPIDASQQGGIDGSS